jgi:hypothetical protein
MSLDMSLAAVETFTQDIMEYVTRDSVMKMNPFNDELEIQRKIPS